MPRQVTDIETELIGRTACVMTAIAEGYGQKHSLRNFLSCIVDRQIANLQPIVDHLAGDKESWLNFDFDVLDLLHEHATLTGLREKAQAVIDNPNYPGT